MISKRLNKKGQAVAELAILGTLILMGFAYIMNFGQSFSAIQQVKMETFRRAMQKAYIRNSPVDYTLKKTTRTASINSGFWQGQASSPQASSKVMWQKGSSGDYKTEGGGSYSFWQINDILPGQDDYGLPRVPKTVVGNDGSDRDVEIPVSIYKLDETRTENYSFSSSKVESNSGIDYEKNADLTDTTTGIAYTHYDTAVDGDPWDDTSPTPVYSAPSATDYTTSKPYTYNNTWNTPHN